MIVTMIVTEPNSSPKNVHPIIPVNSRRKSPETPTQPLWRPCSGEFQGIALEVAQGALRWPMADGSTVPARCFETSGENVGFL
jgi:hypothetical protein